METYICGYHLCTDKPVLRQDTMHGHDFYEIYCFLDGNADYCVEGKRYHLQHGDIMVMRKGEIHTIQFRTSSRYERMYVHFDISCVLDFMQQLDLLSIFYDCPQGKFNHFPAEHLPSDRLQIYMKKIASADNDAKKLCYLLPLLSELNEAFIAVKSAPTRGEKDPVAPVIKYINKNLSASLSLDLLSQQFYMSKTHLNRLFKNSTGTTIWEYISVKRLFLAKELLASGRLPTDIYQQCGFSDYTTFYRSYKRHFGFSPKAHMKVLPNTNLSLIKQANPSM